MKKGTPKTSEAILIGTRVQPEVRDAFAEIARANSRSVAGEIRVMIERRIGRSVTTALTIAVFIALAVAVGRLKRNPLDALLTPEPTTPRPERAEHIDLDGAWKPIGPIWPWEDTRKGDSRGHS